MREIKSNTHWEDQEKLWKVKKLQILMVMACLILLRNNMDWIKMTLQMLL